MPQARWRDEIEGEQSWEKNIVGGCKCRRWLTFSRDAASTGSKAACSSQSQSSRSSKLSSCPKGRISFIFLKRSSTKTAELWEGIGLDSFGGGLEAGGSLDSWGMASRVFRSASRSLGIVAGDVTKANQGEFYVCTKDAESHRCSGGG
jgi:hypothetical protein